MGRIGKCFVIMPSGRHDEYERTAIESNFVFKEIIVPAVNEALGEDVQIIREVDRRLPGAITKEIVRNTVTSELAIVDITGQNPNVFFELGIRYALRRNCTILLRQEKTEIPFDISNYRCVTYDPHFHNDKRSRQDLVEAINSAMLEIETRSDSLVFDVFPTLYVEIPGILAGEEDAATTRTMRWSEYWQQVEKIVGAIRDQFQNGRYVPSVIVAISNGGMMYADLLGRELFQRVPILALWANRWSKDAVYFNDEINSCTVDGVREILGNGRTEVLLVDDIVASGYTIRQALNFLSEKLPDSSISFMPLFCKNEKYFDNIRDNLIWFKDQFKFTDQKARDMHRTEAHKLPYGKEIRSA
jgi:hypoxanthine phosphoribosyltransferase